MKYLIAILIDHNMRFLIDCDAFPMFGLCCEATQWRDKKQAEQKLKEIRLHPDCKEAFIVAIGK
jgi:hypothetical protein